MTHWGFGQLARMVKAPAGYLRTPANIAADLTQAYTTPRQSRSTAVIRGRPPKDETEYFRWFVP